MPGKAALFAQVLTTSFVIAILYIQVGVSPFQMPSRTEMHLTVTVEVVVSYKQTLGHLLLQELQPNLAKLPNTEPPLEDTLPAADTASDL